MAYLTFTPKARAAVLHRLEIHDCISEVFADTDGMEHLAGLVEARAIEMIKQLNEFGKVFSDPASELDMELLRECVEGSTWVGICEPYSNEERQAKAHLRVAAKIIEQFYCLEPGEIEVPQA